MMKFLVTFLLMLAACASGVRQPTSPAKGVGPEAVWHPPVSFRERVIEQCSSPKVRDFGDCFISVMQGSNAPSAAIGLARSIGNTGYLRGFREAGMVDVAFVEYPFRANERYGCLLVNGDPSVIDIDDYRTVEKIDLKKDEHYGKIAAAFSRVDFWPGDRYGADCIVPGALKDKQRFLVTYRLLNGCHACELLGFARVAFDFDRAGKFLGTHLLAVEAAIIIIEELEKPANLTAGQRFAVVLESNRTTGYRWEVSGAGDAAVVKSLAAEYSDQRTGRPGAGGQEIWTFEAVGKGKTEIAFRYMRPWEKNTPPAKTATLTVNVE